MTSDYDAILIVSFGGPEGMDDVMPFLENVLRGRNVPRERMIEVSHHYEQFGGVSPLNGQNRALIAALRQELDANDISLPIYWGNRNWHPMLPDTLRQMKQDGIRHALAFFTSAYSSYSGCRQYRENIAKAQEEVGEGVPQVSLLRKFYNHPGFVETNAELVREALNEIPTDRHAAAHIAFTAHSIPMAMAKGSMYEAQLTDTCGLIAGEVGTGNWQLVYQSRSGPPTQPWLEPDILDHLRSLHERGVRDVVISPVGFVSDHMEVLYDLDTEAKDLAAELGMTLVRAKTVGTHPRFVAMIRELIVERMTDGDRPFLGARGPSHDVCPANCCIVVRA
ncbi:MAG TPA: ferrochelatase [Tepidisphaeraceae bacterium]|jgi:ferrochelatase|nr:ferrochelatase [Tepidisphaeraceae bacterium]